MFGYKLLMKLFYYEARCTHCGKIFFVSSVDNNCEQCCSYNCAVNAISKYLSTTSSSFRFSFK